MYVMSREIFHCRADISTWYLFSVFEPFDTLLDGSD